MIEWGGSSWPGENSSKATRAPRCWAPGWPARPSQLTSSRSDSISAPRAEPGRVPVGATHAGPIVRSMNLLRGGWHQSPPSRAAITRPGRGRVLDSGTLLGCWRSRAIAPVGADLPSRAATVFTPGPFWPGPRRPLHGAHEQTQLMTLPLRPIHPHVGLFNPRWARCRTSSRPNRDEGATLPPQRLHVKLAVVNGPSGRWTTTGTIFGHGCFRPHIHWPPGLKGAWAAAPATRSINGVLITAGCWASHPGNASAT